MSMMCRPKLPFLLMCVFHDVRHVEFRGLTGSQRTPRVWGVTFTAMFGYGKIEGKSKEKKYGGKVKIKIKVEVNQHIIFMGK